MGRGSLHDALYKHPDKEISWKARNKVAVEVAKAMVYLHSELPGKRTLAHLDLKPGNVLLGVNWVKVADFGLCRMGMNTLGTAKSADGRPGTLEYMAPEIHNGAGIGTASDVYSFAVIMWELCARQRPCLGFDHPVARKQLPALEALLGVWVCEGMRPTIPAGCPPAWLALILDCWQPLPGARPKFREIVPRLLAMRLEEAAPPPLTLPTVSRVVASDSSPRPRRSGRDPQPAVATGLVARLERATLVAPAGLEASSLAKPAAAPPPASVMAAAAPAGPSAAASAVTTPDAAAGHDAAMLVAAAAPGGSVPGDGRRLMEPMELWSVGELSAWLSEVARQPAVAAAAAAEEVRQPARICLACETIYLEILGNR
jgi:serine/threonine protein kinase